MVCKVGLISLLMMLSIGSGYAQFGLDVLPTSERIRVLIGIDVDDDGDEDIVIGGDYGLTWTVMMLQK